jgi:hypothetical protein
MMNVSTVLYNVGYGLSCAVFLAGVIAGIVLITRKRTLAGILAAVGFAMFGGGVLTAVICFVILLPKIPENFITLSTVYNCVSGPLFFLGTVALIVALFTNKPPKNPVVTSSPQIPVEQS